MREHPLAERARRVLEKNRCDGYTRPAPGLYAHQWSWDTCFIALGYARFAPLRGARELEALFEGQWANGMVPHVVYRRTDDRYFPDPALWEVSRAPAAPANPYTSGATQPPVHATAARAVYEAMRDAGEAHAFLERLFPRLAEWHAYLHRDRDPLEEGLVAIRHPWESGMDNSPAWDPVFRHEAFDAVPAYDRKDKYTPASPERPTDEAYDRYLYLVELAREADYDEGRLVRDGGSPFLVQDVLFNTLLARADRDLAALARALGSDPEPFARRGARTASAIDRLLWDDALGLYVNRDLHGGARLRIPIAGGFAPLFAGIPNRVRADRMLRVLAGPRFGGADGAGVPVASYDRTAPGFSRRRYWRGPVWMNMNWILWRGLLRYDRASADRMRQAMVDLVSRGGFREYFDPVDGCGLGERDFSWTAALLLDTLHASPERMA